VPRSARSHGAKIRRAVEARQNGASVRGVCCAQWGSISQGAIQMLDLILPAVGLGFFVLSVGYAYACERL
jgi:hypothetical protein